MDKNLFSINAKYEDVVINPEALMFHYERKVKYSATDKLATQCYQFIMQMANETRRKEVEYGEDTGS